MPPAGAAATLTGSWTRLRSALSKAHKLGEITSVPAIATVPRDRYERRLPSLEEMAAFWSAAEEPHLKMF